MTRKIFRSVFTVSLCTLFAAIFIIFGVLYGYFENMQKSRLKEELSYASAGVAESGEDYLKSVKDEDARLTLIDINGNVIYDTNATASNMENHKDRKEIQEANETGVGEDTRFSATLLEKTTYIAKKLPNGEVLRISSTRYSVFMLVLGIMQPIIIVIVIAIILSAFLAKKMAERIVAPINDIDIDNPLDNEVYDEVSPLLTHIEQQNRKIQTQLHELSESRREFDAITDNMREGLILLGKTGKILSLNRAALEIFDAKSDSVGQNFLTIERSPEIDKAIKRAFRDGKAEASLSKGGREYGLNISRIETGNKISGAVILVFDVTDKAIAERSRKEFTANVSHELKTPLQTIMGSAELIQNGLVKNGDIPDFLGNIQKEAARLVTLIDDIIRLSRLDEGADTAFPSEKVDLLEVTKDTANQLKPIADKRNIEIEVLGESAFIDGSTALASEMIYNLMENAVKYNKDGGKVRAEINMKDGQTKFVISDTGIGIPKEDRERVFERFYRVDKSRSKQIGGTGLGLSIVKHAAAYLGAEIELESEEEKGTKITLIFKSENI